MFSTALLAAVSCGSYSHVKPEETAAEIARLLRLGESQKARDLAHEVRLQKSSPQDSENLRLLESEAILELGLPDEALELLAAPPQTDSAGLLARHRMLTAQALMKKGQDLETPLRLLEDARDIAARESLENLLVQVEVRRGQLLSDLGRYDEAEKVLRNAERSAAVTHDPYYRAAALSNIGLVYFRRSRLDEAIPMYERAAEQARLAGSVRFQASILGNLGVCYGRLGRFETALELRQQAIALQQEHGYRYSLQISYGAVGDLYFMQRQFAEAAQNYRSALDLALQIGASGYAASWANSLAETFTELGSADQAGELLDQSLQLRGDSNRRSAAYWQLTTAEIASLKGDADAERLWEKAVAITQESSEWSDLSWEAHAGLARLLMKQGRVARADQEYAAAIQIIEQRQEELKAYEDQITYLARLIRFYQDYVDALVTRGKQREALLVAESSKARSLRRGFEARDLESVRDFSMLTDWTRARDDYLLSYWLAPERSFVWLIGPDGIRFSELPSQAEIAKRIEALRSLVADNIRDPLRLGLKESFILSEVLLDPIREAIPKGARVIAVPDGDLYRINLETLPIGGDQPHYWIEDVRLSVSPSIATAIRQEPLEPRPSVARVLVVGDPVPTPKFPSLRHAAAEMEAIADDFPAGQARILQGPDATRSAFLQAQPEDYDFIHFASHAEANDRTPLESAIILSPDQATGKLYARDIADLQLRARLVTLSACRSAGNRAFLGEGLVGFSWAFQRAGAHKVIAGLWNVSDLSSMQIMEHVYKGVVSGEDAGDALREAKLEMLRSERQSAPYFWGALQLFVG